jgi:hypothetical protein
MLATAADIVADPSAPDAFVQMALWKVKNGFGKVEFSAKSICREDIQSASILCQLKDNLMKRNKSVQTFPKLLGKSLNL